MKRVAIATGLFVAAAAAAIGAAGAAEAAPTCPAPIVTVSPTQNVSQDGTLTITAQHLLCNAKPGQTGTVYFSLHYPHYGADYSTNNLTVPNSGNLTYAWKLSSSFFTAPAGTKITLGGLVSSPAGDKDLTGPTITLAAPPPGAGRETAGYNGAPTNGAPTAVPAGHVDTSPTSAVSMWETGALVLGGVGLLGAGVATATRRRGAAKH
jgi:hypothetical protein